MSLLERARRASAGEAAGPTETDDAFARLRSQVQETLEAVDVAALFRENPVRAKNEVRAACLRVFAQESWSGATEVQRERLCEAVLDSMFGFGPLEAMLADDGITEIMVNNDRVFYERDGIIHGADLKFADGAQVRLLIDRILGPLGRRIDESSPMVNARLPQGHRVNAVIPPVSPDGPMLTIRKFSARVLTLEDLQGRGTLPPPVREVLEWAVRSRKNIAVSGGTGSGKTTLLNALSCCIPAAERIITIEDSAELRFLTHPNVVRLEARPANAEGRGCITIRELLINALRMRPDRIVVGECRGAEALDMLQAMNTGHDGSMTTLHANSPAEVLPRLATMVRYGADVPLEAVEADVARAIDLVVQMARLTDGRRVISEIARMTYDEENRRARVSTLYRDGAWLEELPWPDAPRVDAAEQEEPWQLRVA